MYCFCTLAVGEEYRILAKKLAKDIELNCPGTDFLVITDKKEDFSDRLNTKPFDYRPVFPNIVYDKIFAAEKALARYESVVYIDADSRIYGKITQEPEFLPGLTALSCHRLTKNFEGRLDKERAIPLPVGIGSMSRFNPIKYMRIINFLRLKNKITKKLSNKLRVLQKLAAKLKVDMQNTKFVHEIFFVLTKQGGIEKEFFRQYDRIARYLQLHGFSDAEGCAIGLAAEKSNFTVMHDEGLNKNFYYFKDRILDSKIKKNQAFDIKELELLNEHKSVVIHPIIKQKIKAHILKWYLTGKLFVRTLGEIKFYHF